MKLLDTDIMIDLLRGYPPAITWLESVGEEEIVLPGLVVMEAMQGCKNKRELKKLFKKLEAYDIYWPSLSACTACLEVFGAAYLSHRLSIPDALIGHMAVDMGLPLYSFNEKHFAAIPNLETIQPYQKEGYRRMKQ